MRGIFFALALLGATATAASAQNAIPDLKGTWTGKGKAIVFGTNLYHPGSQTANDAPRVSDIEATHVVEGQDGGSPGGAHPPRLPTPRSRSPGRSPATTNRSSAAIWTAISTLHWSHLTVWRSATSTTAPARPIQWW